MTARRIAVMATLILSATGCATTSPAQSAATRTDMYACGALDGTLSSGATFDAPLTVVERERVYRYEGRAQRRIPEGVSLRVRAEPGLTAPDVHRVVACRMDRGAETRIGVRPRGATYEVVVLSAVPSVAREIQAEHAPVDG